MIWVCRPGEHSKDYDMVKKHNDIFLGWSGYKVDLHKLRSMESFRELVIAEKHPTAPTTISTWAGQLYSFCCEMKPNDYVLIPNIKSREFMLAVIDGDYRYESHRKYPHVRRIRVIREGIPRSSFSQATQYSLGAYRTVFKVKQQEEVLKIANIK